MLTFFHIQPFVESVLHELDRPRPYAYTRATQKKPDKVFIEYERAMGQEALEIHRKAHNCEKEALPEPSWDAEVYDPLLNLVLRHPKFNGALKCVNMYVSSSACSPQTRWRKILNPFPAPQHASRLKASR